MNAPALPLPLSRAAPTLEHAIHSYADLSCGVIKFGATWRVFWRGEVDPLDHPTRLEAVDWLRALAKAAEVEARQPERVPT